MRLFFAYACLILLTACHPSSSLPTAVPTPSQLAQTTISSATTSVPSNPRSPSSIVPTPPATAPPFADQPVANPAPFQPTRLERYPLAAGGRAIAWLPQDQGILYADTSIYRFDTASHQTLTIVSDHYPLNAYEHIYPAWDSIHQLIIYAQQKTKSTADIVAIDLAGTLVRTLATDIFISDGWQIYRSDARRKANTVARSVFDISIATNGLVGVLEPDRIISRRADLPDRELMLPTSVVKQLADMGEENYHQLWLAPDGQHYALAITETLSVYADGIATPLLSLNVATDLGPVSWRPILVIRLQWSPDSTAIYYQPAWIESVGDYHMHGPYVQSISEARPHILGHGSQLPTVPGGSGVATAAAWSPDSRWLAIGLRAQVQCGGTAIGCFQSQAIVDPFAARASVIWAEKSYIDGQVVWSADATRIATPCWRFAPGSLAEMCILTLAHIPP